MTGAVAAARGGETPAELQLAFWCGDEHLPTGGGVLDQDYALMKRMRVARNIYEVTAYTGNLQGKDIHKLTDQQRRIIRYLRDNGYW